MCSCTTSTTSTHSQLPPHLLLLPSPPAAFEAGLLTPLAPACCSHCPLYAVAARLLPHAAVQALANVTPSTHTGSWLGGQPQSPAYAAHMYVVNVQGVIIQMFSVWQGLMWLPVMVHQGKLSTQVCEGATTLAKHARLARVLLALHHQLQ
jgi:hypothetical protein